MPLLHHWMIRLFKFLSSNIYNIRITVLNGNLHSLLLRKYGALYVFTLYQDLVDSAISMHLHSSHTPSIFTNSEGGWRHHDSFVQPPVMHFDLPEINKYGWNNQMISCACGDLKRIQKLSYQRAIRVYFIITERYCLKRDG